MKHEKIIGQTRHYYNEKLREHGPNARGLDWNSEESAVARYRRLLEIINTGSAFTILDYGCGFGLMYKYMQGNFKKFDYTGYDISDEMILQAKELFHEKNAEWVSAENELKQYDFVVASGIFNVKQDTSNEEWKEYILDTINSMNRISKEGFSFNFLTKYCDIEFMKDSLYYADPAFFFEYSLKNFSKHVALLHDYPLYEFSILVRKNV